MLGVNGVALKLVTQTEKWKPLKYGTGGLTMRLIDADRLQTAFLADLDTAMSSYSGDMVQIMLIDIDECPTVDAALVVHGRWVFDAGFEFCWKCSKCKYPAPFDKFAKTQEKTPYCPNCGAKMDGGPTNENN